jgi:effector-binding domain-containing protein
MQHRMGERGRNADSEVSRSLRRVLSSAAHTLLLGLRRSGDAGEKAMIPSRNLWLSAVAAAAVSFAVLSPATPQAPPFATPPAATSDDSFGEEVTLVEKTIVYIAGSGMWDSAFNTIIGGFKTVNGAMANLGLKASGAPMIIYTETDDTGFHFQAAVPVAQAPTGLENTGISVGKSPSGKALKFVHRGSYDDMDSIYELITNYLDEKQLEPKDMFVEQFMKDPITTPEDYLVIEVYVPLK